uniref:DapH/DapD/GlmU-related protein n=1 Tax=Serratia marcescens TaxID=615 RepID=UPI0011E892C4
MSLFISDRPLLLILRFLFFPYNKLRNKYFSFAFSTHDLIVGKNISIVGSKNIIIGSHVILGNQTWLDAIGTGSIIIGNDVSLSQNVHISAAKSVTIDDGCLIGSDVLISDHDHSFGGNSAMILPKHRPLSIRDVTKLGKNCWLGDNVKILSGVTLGSNVVVAANSVVTRSFP